MTSRSELLENAIKNNPLRYIVFRDKDNNLVQVQDTDSGVMWIKTCEGWSWID